MKVSYFWQHFEWKMNITVIGETNIDIAVVPCKDTAHVSACTPSRIRFHHGGVARNIAHNLSLLGHKVRLMTVFGDDDFARQLIGDCQSLGMDLSLSTQFKDAKSPVFLSFNDEKGNMQSAVSDVALNDHMDLNWLKGKMDEINRADMVVADTLLSVEALTHLIDCCKVPLFVDTVSPGKALRLVEALEHSAKQSLFAVKCNLFEALAITKESNAENAAKLLNDRGIEHVFITMGEEGVIYCANHETKHFPALPSEVINVTGSGDAFLAGVVHGYAMGLMGEKAIPLGLKAAQQNIKSEEPVAPSLAL